MKPRQVDWLTGDARFDWLALNSVKLPPLPASEELEPPLNPGAYALGVIACSATKLTTAAPAERLYTGALFRLALSVAKQRCQRVRILSAKHGVLRLDTVVEPYDVGLASYEKHQVGWWAGLVQRALDGWRGQRVLCLASAPYWRPVFGAGAWERPLVGLGIGQQKAVLKAMLAAP